MTRVPLRGPRSPALRVVVVIVAVIVAVELVLTVVEEITGGAGPQGPPSSSYATQPQGLAAFADLAADAGHRVERVRGELADLDPSATLFLVDAGIDGAEVDEVARFVDSGGRLVAAGATAVFAAAEFVDGAPRWRPEAGTNATPVLPSWPNVATVVTAGEGGFSDAGDALPVMAAGSTPVLAVARRGSGTVWFLADPSPLRNRFLARPDNAALGLSLAGPPERPVLFAEGAHGYGAVQGWAALPEPWKWALAVALLAALVWMWSRGRRLGPPDVDEREPAPPRRAYVDALAATLLKTGDPAGAIGPVQGAARQIVARRSGVAPDADADVRRAAIGLGLTEHDADAIIAPVRSHDDAIRAARALARLQGP